MIGVSVDLLIGGVIGWTIGYSSRFRLVGRLILIGWLVESEWFAGWIRLVDWLIGSDALVG